jgi:hypothetical protein
MCKEKWSRGRLYAYRWDYLQPLTLVVLRSDKPGIETCAQGAAQPKGESTSSAHLTRRRWALHSKIAGCRRNLKCHV